MILIISYCVFASSVKGKELHEDQEEEGGSYLKYSVDKVVDLFLKRCCSSRIYLCPCVTR